MIVRVCRFQAVSRTVSNLRFMIYTTFVPQYFVFSLKISVCINIRFVLLNGTSPELEMCHMCITCDTYVIHVWCITHVIHLQIPHINYRCGTISHVL